MNRTPDPPRPLKSCGFLILRTEPELSFLLMKHVDRWDLPKGHVDAGEDELTCALRELEEETSLRADQLRLDSRFRYEAHYTVRYKRTGNVATPKTLVVFLACLKHDGPIQATEHLGHAWFAWRPPHKIQTLTIDPLLSQLEKHLAAGDPICDGQPPKSRP